MKTWNKLVIAGGTGFLGSNLVRYFESPCREIVILSREERPAHGHVRYVAWDGRHTGAWSACLEGAEFRPDCCGVIVADEYDAEIVRPAPSQPLAAARRKAETERLARAALRRLVTGADPECGGWGRVAG